MRKRGISLIILIITIVVMIILATAIMVNIAQTNVIKNANIAVFKADVSAMKDELEMYISDKYTETVGEYEPEKLQATEEGIWYGSNQEEGNIKNILKSMNDKYLGKLFIQDGKLVANKLNITLEEEKLLDDIGVKPAYKTEIGKIEITPSTIEWINGDVTLSISYTKEMPQGYVLEYKINDGNFQEGTQVLVEENNTKVTVRLYSREKDNEALVNSYEVSNIDKVAPDITNMKIEVTTGVNSVTAVASGATDSLSGNVTYEYSKDNSTWQDSGTFTDIKSGTEVTIQARAVDKVGNVSESKSSSDTTSSLGQVTILQSPAATTSNGEVNWTSGNVTVTLSHAAVSGYTLQYKLSGGMTQNWTTYSSAIIIDTNNTTVATRMYNSTLDDEGNSANTKTISNIDKENPTKPTSVSLSIGTNSVTATASGSTDGLSGFRKYQYSLNNGSWQDSGTFTNIKSGTEVTIQARAVDKVGNVSESKSSSDTTSSLGQVTILQSPAATTSNGEVNWTSGNVTVTLSHAAVSGYTLQYKLSGGMTQNWTTYSSAITIDTNNTTVATRMYNSTLDDEGNSANTKTISNIDKENPTSATLTIIKSSGELYNGEPIADSVTIKLNEGSDELSGISRYRFILADSDTQKELDIGINDFPYEFSKVGVYSLKVQTFDVAGNSSIKSYSINIKPNATASNTYSYDYDISKAFDNDENSYWLSGNNSASVTMDLRNTYLIKRLWIRWNVSPSPSKMNVQIKVTNGSTVYNMSYNDLTIYNHSFEFYNIDKTGNKVEVLIDGGSWVSCKDLRITVE